MPVFFDLDETLVDHVSAEKKAALGFHERFRDEMVLTPQDFVAQWHGLAEKWFELYGKGLVTFREQRRGRLQEIFAGRGFALTDREADARFDAYIALYEHHWALFDDVLPCLDALKGERLGVITNGVPEQQDKKLARTGIKGRFADVLCSVEVGLAKPDPEIFRLAAKRAGARIEDCVYVGDRLDTDAQAARKAGMRGVWLNRSGNKKGNGVPTLRSLRDLKAFALSPA